MLTSFFGNSKPINFVVIAIYMVVFYYSALFVSLRDFVFGDFLKETGILLLFLFSMVLSNFIAKRNELTQRNAYKALFFAVFTCLFSEILENNTVLIANVFVLLALRRIISLKSQRHTVKKIFDASFWICIASLFHFWSILFLIIVFLGIFLHTGRNYKTWLVPFVAVLTVTSLVITVYLMVTNNFYGFQNWFQESNFNFSAYLELSLLIPVVFLLLTALWSFLFYITRIQKTSSNLKLSMQLVLFFALVALAVAVLAPTKNGSEFLFFMAPLAILTTNYFQTLPDKWFKELILWILVIMPIVLIIVF